MRYNVVRGTRDFLPSEMIKRKYIFTIIEEVFKTYGYLPIETPSIENLNTLMGKYGEEGDRLIYKILKSGDYLRGVNQDKDLDHRALTSEIADKGLRYDLTVPFARFVVNNRNDLVFPFKRYQIQPVWRADRPQKGRYREFYQCDVDVIGSNSLLNELELCEIIDKVFLKLNLQVVIRINNRKILSSIAELIGKPEMLIDITVAIDKIDKIGYDKVVEELIEKGLNQDDIQKIEPILSLEGSNREKLESLRPIIENTESGQKGLEEIELLLELIENANLSNELVFDIRLARGLNYYTGTIFEVESQENEIGSITGGGRYDDLTGIFGVKDLSGVGISFGADRIYDCLEELGRFPEKIDSTTEILFVNFGHKESLKVLEYAQALRLKSISTEVYPDQAKLQRQMKYANDKNINYVALVGEREMEEKKIMLKNMITGEQKLLGLEELIVYLQA